VLCRKVVHGYNTNAVEDKDKKKCFNDLQWHDLVTECNENGTFDPQLYNGDFFLYVCTVIPFINEPSYIKVSGKHIYVFMTYSISCCLCDMYGSIECVCMYVDM